MSPNENINSKLSSGIIDLAKKVKYSGLIKQPSVGLHNKLLREKTTWYYSNTKVIIENFRYLEYNLQRDTNFEQSLVKEVRNYTFNLLKNFTHFNSSFATVRESPQGKLRFTLLGVKGALSALSTFLPYCGNDVEVVVFKSENRSNFEIQGNTGFNHQLVGIRKWRVDDVSEPGYPAIQIMTYASEHEREMVNQVGAGFARKDQKEIWIGYLARPADATQAHPGVGSGA